MNSSEFDRLFDNGDSVLEGLDLDAESLTRLIRGRSELLRQRVRVGGHVGAELQPVARAAASTQVLPSRAWPRPGRSIGSVRPAPGTSVRW